MACKPVFSLWNALKREELLVNYHVGPDIGIVGPSSTGLPFDLKRVIVRGGSREKVRCQIDVVGGTAGQKAGQEGGGAGFQSFHGAKVGRGQAGSSGTMKFRPN